jgi:sugar phosphate isomerase/epimerase
MLKSRRTFLQNTALTLAALGTGMPLLADARNERPARQPVGFQLYTLGDAIVTDTVAVLAKLASFGYGELEAITYANLPPETLRRRVDEAGMKLRSVHLDFSGERDTAKLFDTAHRLGVNQVVSSVLSPSVEEKHADLGALTADDFKRVAERANGIGEAAKKSGLRYAYHNHDFEFRKFVAGGSGYDIVLAETDPGLVYFQADCGWMSKAGANPVSYFTRYPKRYLSAHIKDFDASGHIVELGHGVVPYRPILRAARQAGIGHLFVEHDPPGGVPIPLDQVRREGAYLGGLIHELSI